MIVPASTIEDLTGYVRHSAQIRWLQKRGWKFEVSRMGAPRVDRAEYARHMIGGKAGRNQEVNLEGING